MVVISIDGENLRVDVQGMHRFWALKSRLTIPLTHVRGATADPGIIAEPKGWRAPGTHLPGVIVAGTFYQDGARVFFDVRHQDRAIVIELKDDTYQRLVIEVDDPRAAVETIEQAVAQR